MITCHGVQICLVNWRVSHHACAYFPPFTTPTPSAPSPSLPATSQKWRLEDYLSQWKPQGKTLHEPHVMQSFLPTHTPFPFLRLSVWVIVEHINDFSFWPMIKVPPLALRWQHFARKEFSSQHMVVEDDRRTRVVLAKRIFSFVVSQTPMNTKGCLSS